MAQKPNDTLSTAGTYYLASYYLSTKKFDDALTAFEKLLAPTMNKILVNENRNICKIKVNRLLAILGKNKDKTEVNRLVGNLFTDSDCEGQQKALEGIETIRKEVNNPWRFLKFNN